MKVAYHVLEPDTGLRDFLELGLRLAEIHGATHSTGHSTAATALGATSEQGEKPQQQETREQQGLQSCKRTAGAVTVALRNGDVDPVLGKGVNQVGIVREDDAGTCT